MAGYGLSDQDLDEMFGEANATQTSIANAESHAMQTANGETALAMPTIIPLGQAMPETSLITRRVGPLPVWGWSLVVLGVGAGGWWWYSREKDKVRPNDGGKNDDEQSASDSEEWGPSRQYVGDVLRKYYTRKGQAEKVQIFTEATEARKKLRHVSPLVTIKPEGKAPLDKEIVKLARREGLNPILHEDGTIGLYPHTGKRGKAWEEYVDYLRDKGQKD